MPHTPLLEVEIEASSLADFEQFEAARQEAYDDPEHRNERLQTLVETAQLAGGVAVYEAVLDTLTQPADEAEAIKSDALSRFESISDKVATTNTHRKHDALTYRISIDDEGDVRAVSKIEPIKEDKKLTQRSQKIADQTGYGPKMNDSSFKISSVDAHRRRG